MKRCPECGEDTLNYLGNGAFECLSCGKRFEVDGVSDEERLPQSDAEENSVDTFLAETEQSVPEEEGPVVSEEEETAAADVEESEESAECPVSVYADDSAEEADEEGFVETFSDEEFADTYPEDAESSDAEEETLAMEGQTDACDIQTQPQEETDGESAAEKKNGVQGFLFVNEKRRVLAERLSDVRSDAAYSLTMKIVPAALMILFGILMLGLMGGAVAGMVIPEIFASDFVLEITGYDVLGMGAFAEAFTNAYGASAFIVAMAVILVLAGGAQLALALLDKSDKTIKYGFYVGEMCVLACVFVAACALIGGANEEMKAGPCAIVILLFTMIWMAALPFVYVLSIVPNAVACKEYLVAYFGDVATASKNIIAKIKADNERRRAIAATATAATAAAGEAVCETFREDGDDDFVQTYSDEYTPTGEIIEGAEDDEDVMETSCAEDDVFVCTTEAYGTSSDAYSSRFNLSFDDVIESIYVRGRYAGLRVVSGLLPFVVSLVQLICVFAMYEYGAPDITGIMFGCLLIPLFAYIVMAAISDKHNMGRIPLTVVWLISWFGFVGGFISWSILAYRSDSVYVTFVLLDSIAAVVSAVFFGIGMGRHYDKKLPLPQKSRRAQTVLVAVFLSLVLLLSIVPGCIYADSPFYDRMSDVEVGMSQKEVKALFGKADYTTGENDNVLYFTDNITAKRLYAELQKLSDKLERLGPYSSETASVLDEIMSLESDIERGNYRYFKLEFDAGKKTLMSVTYIPETKIGDSVTGNPDVTYSFVTNSVGDGLDDSSMYMKVRYEDSSSDYRMNSYAWRECYQSVTIADMIYYPIYDSLEIYYSLVYADPAYPPYTAAYSGSVEEVKKYMPNVANYYNTYFAQNGIFIPEGGSTPGTGGDTELSGTTQYFIWNNDATCPFEFDTTNYSLTSTNHNDSSSATFSMTFTEACTFAFDYRVSSERNYDIFSVRKNGSEIVRESGNLSSRFSVDMAAGDTLTFTYSKDSGTSSGEDCFYVTNVSVTGVDSQPGQGATTFFTWNNDSAYPFRFNTDNVFFSLASTNHASSSSATFSMTFTEACCVQLSYRVSSEQGCDYFTLKKNNTEVIRQSGNVSTPVVIKVDAGDTLTFTYSKNSSGNSGEDAGIIEEMLVVPVVLIPKVEGSDSYLSWSNENNLPFTVDEVVGGEGYTLTPFEAAYSEECYMKFTALQNCFFAFDCACDANAGDYTLSLNGNKLLNQSKTVDEYLVYVKEGDIITVTYRKPAYNPSEGSNAARFTSIPVQLTGTEAHYGWTADSTYPFYVGDNGTLMSSNKTNNTTSSVTFEIYESGTLTFNYEVSSEGPDYFRVYVNGTRRDSYSGTRSGTLTYSLSAGDEVRLSYSKDGSISTGDDRVRISGFEFVASGTGVVPGDELTDAFSVTNDSRYPFTYNSSSDSYTSTNKSDGTTSTLTLNVTKSGQLRFDWAVSSESSYDKLIVKKNNGSTALLTKSGVENGNYACSVVAGDVITFAYQKDSSQSRNDDEIIISNIGIFAE